MRGMITFLGNGNMATALIDGLYSTYEIEVISRDLTKLNLLKEKYPNISISIYEKQTDITNKNIILCTKPYNLEEVSQKLYGEANSIFSVLAGTPISKLSSNIKAKSYVRAMPNIAAKVHKSMTTLTGDIVSKQLAIDIFNNIGTTLWLENENEIDISTAICGSGPSFLAIINQYFVSSATELGLKPQDAQKLANGLFDGFNELAKDNTMQEITKAVTSPNGTTDAGNKYIQSSNMKKDIFNTLNSAYNRAKEIAKQ